MLILCGFDGIDIKNKKELGHKLEFVYQMLNDQ